MTGSETLFFWATVALYLVSAVGYLGAFAFRRRQWLTPAFRTAVAGFVAHSGVVASRWIATGHAPVMRDYENAIAGAWVIVALFIVLQLRYRWLDSLGLPVMPLAMLMLGYGLMSNPQMEQLTPAYKSAWLAVHVFFAWLAYGAYVVAAGMSVVYLLRRQVPEPEYGNGLRGTIVGHPAVARLPRGEMLDDLTYRVISFGFIANAVMLVAGSIWASRLWGSYWSWDPVETWALISWLSYALYLHGRVALRWRGERMAWFAIVALSTVLIAFWGINFVEGTLHAFKDI